jgi:hypothetical protein
MPLQRSGWKKLALWTSYPKRDERMLQMKVARIARVVCLTTMAAASSQRIITNCMKLKERHEMFIVHRARPIIFSGALALVAGMQPGAAKAAVITTYSGAACVAAVPSGAANLERFDGAVTALAPTEVRCPIVKHNSFSSGRVASGVVASGGTKCELRSYDVFTTSFKRSNIITFPGTGISAINYAISSSNRGAQQLKCNLDTGDTIRNYSFEEE